MKRAGQIAQLAVMYVVMTVIGLAFAISTSSDTGSERAWDILVATILLSPIVILPTLVAVGRWRRRRR